MKDETAKYIRCRTCGKHIEENQSLSKVYCSEECAGIFIRCPNCGNFFNNKDQERFAGFCSLECEAVYDKDGIIISSENQTADDDSDESSSNESQVFEEEQ